jgi:hypothetical protein
MENVYLNNPTIMAVLAIGGICMQAKSSKRDLYSFVKSGGIPAVVRLLTRSTCRLTRVYAAKISEFLLSSWTGMLEEENWAKEVADLFFQAGERGLTAHGTMSNFFLPAFRRSSSVQP